MKNFNKSCASLFFIKLEIDVSKFDLEGLIYASVKRKRRIKANKNTKIYEMEIL